MKPQLLLLITLAATDVLIGIQSIGVFWPTFIFVATSLYLTGKFNLSANASALNRSLSAVLAAMIISVITSGYLYVRATSLVYAAMFFTYGFWLINSSGIFKEAITAKAMKIIIVAYFTSALGATLVIALNIKVSDSFFLTRFWTNFNTGESRPIAFSSEPSYAAFIVVLAWITIVRMNHIQPGRQNGFGLWTAITLVSLQLFGSIYGYLLSVVIVLTSLLLLPKRKRNRWLFGGLILILLFSLLRTSDGDDSRTLRIANAVFTGDLETWLLEDTSSFFRVGPLFAYLTKANFSEVETWLGHGTTSSSIFFLNLFREHIDEAKNAVEMGIIPSYLYDYGLISCVLFLGFLYQVTQGPLRLSMIAILILLVFNANFSTQIMWFAVTCAVISHKSLPDCSKLFCNETYQTIR